MKQYPWKFKISKGMIEWWQTEKTLNSDWYAHYIMIDFMNKEQREAWRKQVFGDGKGWMRHILGNNLLGLHKFWYDCPHAQLNLYFIVLSWSTQWTTMPKDYWND